MENINDVNETNLFSDEDENKRFSTFKGDENAPNGEINPAETTLNALQVEGEHDPHVNMNKDENEAERVSIDSGIPNATIVEDHDGTETMIVYV